MQAVEDAGFEGKLIAQSSLDLLQLRVRGYVKMLRLLRGIEGVKETTNVQS